MSKKNSTKVKIFVGYQKPNVLFQSEVFEPLITSDCVWEDQPDLLRDNTSLNIAEQNKYYGELSGHYWVWKNFLPTTDAEYIGFCHYRRFLDFNLSSTDKVAFTPIPEHKFQKAFQNYTSENILNCIQHYDIILPNKTLLMDPVYGQYITNHPKKDIDIALAIISQIYPEYMDTALKFMHADELYTCMNFVMTKELVDEYMRWIFNILIILEKMSDWSAYNEYDNIRTPAFIAERFFNIWLIHNVETRKLKVLNTSSLLLVGENYASTNQDFYLNLYYLQKEQIEKRRK